MMRWWPKGSSSGSKSGLPRSNYGAGSTSMVLCVNGVVLSVKVGALWQAPHRPDLNSGFLSDTLDPKKISIPSKGSGSFEPGVRVPGAATRRVH